MKKCFAIAALVIVSALCLGAVFSGAGLLGLLVLDGLPAGNALAWFGLMGFSAAALLLARRGSFLGAAVIVLFALSVAWLPVSALLAGNWALNFSGAIGGYWLAGSLGLVALVLAALLASAAAAAYRRLKGSRAA